MDKRIFNYGLSALLLGLTISAPHPVNAQNKCPLNGTWKSNRQLTLDSLNKTGRVNDKQRAFFMRPDLFGHMTVRYDCQKVTTTFEGKSETTQYKIISIKGNQIVLRYFGRDSKQYETRNITLQGNCYAVPVAWKQDFGFSEYFCKVK